MTDAENQVEYPVMEWLRGEHTKWTEDLMSVDRLNAIHEAGHAVMTVLTGTPLAYLTLGHPNAPGGFGSSARAKCASYDDEILIRFAGVGAELVERNERCWAFLFRSSGRADGKCAQTYLYAVPGDRRAYIRLAKMKVLELLQQNWKWVDTVADQLQRSRILLSAQVEAMRPTT